MRIELRGLCKSYDGRRVLDRVSLEIAPGQIVAVLGENGAGKTTLLRCLAGVIAPGRHADLAIFDTDQAHWLPRHDLAASVVYASHPGDITHVMCDGRWLMKDRTLVTLDEERIRREAETRALRLVGTPMRLVRRYRG